MVIKRNVRKMSEESIAPLSTANYRFAAKRVGKYSISIINLIEIV